MPALNITAHEHEHGHVLVLDGEIDMAAEERFYQAIIDAIADRSHVRVVLDCAPLAFIDSSGLRALIHAHKGAKERQSSVLIAAPTQRVAQILRVTAVDTRIPVFPTVESALAAPQTAGHPRG